MIEIPVDLSGRSCSIRIGEPLDRLFATLDDVPGGDLSGARAVVVSDETVLELHGARIDAALRAADMDVSILSVSGGEGVKSVSAYEALATRAFGSGLTRDGLVVAIGGGTTTDAAGFLAATFHRGVRWLAVPTTLLGMADAAIGGKTALDLGGAKNVLGAFHQPDAVLVDPGFLETLDRRQLVSGLVEAIKATIVADAEAFEALAREPGALIDPGGQPLRALLRRAIEVKAAIVAEDERERGRRAVLNLGHTVGHALEAATGFGRWLHGEAVSIGIVAALALSVREVGLPRASLARVRDTLQAIGAPIADPQTAVAAVLPWLSADKKATGAEPAFVLTPRIGSASFGHRIPQAFVKDELARIFGGPPG